MYVCLKACKVGFLFGCRPFIGVDGCYLKGPYPGMLLVAVSMDGNHNIYPVAWAVVETENTETWCWFKDLLMEETQKREGAGLTRESDGQKGGVSRMLAGCLIHVGGVVVREAKVILIVRVQEVGM